MQYCPKCKVLIRGRKTCCPLCEGALLAQDQMLRQGVEPSDYGLEEWDENWEDAAFPVLPKRKMTSHLLFRIGTFLFAAAEILGFALLFLAGDNLPWLPIVMLGVLIAWVDLIATLFYRNNILKVLTVEVLVAIFVNLWVDHLTGWHGWSVEWMIPFSLVGLAVMTIIIGRVRDLRPGEYIIYLVFDAALALLQMIPIHMGLNKQPWPAVLTIASFLILTVAMLIFRLRELKRASERVFNF